MRINTVVDITDRDDRYFERVHYLINGNIHEYVDVSVRKADDTSPINSKLWDKIAAVWDKIPCDIDY